MKARFGLFFSFLVFCSEGFSHPVPYLGGTSISSMVQKFQTDSALAYSFHRNAAVGFRAITSKGREGNMSYIAPQVNVLLKRWNGDGYQSNIYFMGGVGLMKYRDYQHSSILSEIDADAESRRCFASTKLQSMLTGIGSNYVHVQSRLGFAPYKAEFNEVSTWFMVQHDFNSLLEKKEILTPLIRFYYENYLFEAGRSLEGDWMLNFMVHI